MVNCWVQSGKGGAYLGRGPEIVKASQWPQPKVRPVCIEGAHALCAFILNRLHRDVAQVGRRVPRRECSSASPVQGSCNCYGRHVYGMWWGPKQVTEGDLSATTQVKRIGNERMPAVKVVELQIDLGSK